jgi:hypothetical protein
VVRLDGGSRREVWLPSVHLLRIESVDVADEASEQSDRRAS